MRKLLMLLVFQFLLILSSSAQDVTQKAPAIYASTHGNKATFVYIPGQIAVAEGAEEPKFDEKTAASFKQYCPQAKVLAVPTEADYIVFYSEWTKRDAMIVRNDGEVVWVGSSFWEKKTVVKKACAALLSDWKKKTIKPSKPQS